MTNIKNNEYVKSLIEKVKDWERTADELKEIKPKREDFNLEDAYEAAMDSWYNACGDNEYPLNDGEDLFYKCAVNYMRWESGLFGRAVVLDDSIGCDRAGRRFADCCKHAGVDTIIVTNQGTGLMDTMHALNGYGFKPVGLGKIGSPEFGGGTEYANMVVFKSEE